VVQKVETRLIDDLDGSTAAETVAFVVEGREYEIDLSEANAARLRDSLAEFVAAARKSGGRARSAGPAKPAKRTTADREHGVAVREWARTNGYDVSGRGRIPRAVVEAYEQRGLEVTAQPGASTSDRPEVTEPFTSSKAAG
jgi:hypothetical protein